MISMLLRHSSDDGDTASQQRRGRVGSLDTCSCDGGGRRWCTDTHFSTRLEANEAVSWREV